MPPRANSSRSALRLAARQLQTRDCHELWVPDPVSYRDFFVDVDALVDLGTDRMTGISRPEAALRVDVPKNHYFLRRAVLLNPIDRLAYHAIVLGLQPEAERSFHVGVMAGRRARRADHLFQHPVSLWLRWRRRTITALRRKKDSWAIRTDLSSYFDNVRHDFLLEQLAQLGATKQRLATLDSLLDHWTDVSGTGIPQGPDVSRLLGNAYLMPVDAATSSAANVHYSRYMDDIVIVGDRRSVIDAFRAFEESARTLGLSVSSEKTRLDASGDAIASLKDDELSSLSILYKASGSDADVKRRLRRLVRTALNEETGRVDSRRSRFALGRLSRMSDHTLDHFLLKHMEYFAPVAPFVSRYLAPRMKSRRVIDGVSDFLNDPGRNTSDYLSTWLMATMVDSSKEVHLDWVRYARTRVRSADCSQYERAIALNLIGKAKRRADLRDLKDLATDIESPWDARAAGTALARRNPRLRMPRSWSRHEYLRWTREYLDKTTPGACLPPW